MNNAAAVLRRAADYYRRNPNAMAEGRYLGSVLASQPGGGKDLAIDAVRAAIGTPGVVGAMVVWSKKHSAADAAALLNSVADSFSDVD